MDVTTGTIPVCATHVVLPGKVEPEGLQISTGNIAVPEAGHVVLAMEATGVSFAEQQMRRGKYYDQPPFPFVPGYDLVGTTVALGAGVDPALLGRRFAAVTKTGAWSTHVEVAARALLPVPAAATVQDIESLVVNGITAWQLLHRTAKVRPGATIVVLGANGGVGNTLVQLARHAGVTVIGTASPSHHDALRAFGVTPVDYRDPDAYVQIRGLAPAGVDAVFDHVGGEGLVASWTLLRRGGTLVSYGTAATKDEDGNSQLPVLKVFLRLALWNLLPNGRGAHFYNFWAGRRHAARFHARQREAFSAVMALLTDGSVTPQVSACFPLSQAAAALRLAESRTVAGKVVLLPDV
ncbi:MAG: medium chain dehydrogenase/reductase family protein [Janthinobacterium lividum]